MTDIDIRAIAQCSCLRLRRTTRRVTQIYDRLLEPAGLTVNQFGLLARLYGANLRREILPIGTLAERVGMDPTTLNRSLKPLEAARPRRQRDRPGRSACPGSSDHRTRRRQAGASGSVVEPGAGADRRGARSRRQCGVERPAGTLLRQARDVARWRRALPHGGRSSEALCHVRAFISLLQLNRHHSHLPPGCVSADGGCATQCGGF